MKKLIALLLAACLMLGLMTTAFAADEKSNDIVILYTCLLYTSPSPRD